MRGGKRYEAGREPEWYKDKGMDAEERELGDIRGQESAIRLDHYCNP